MSSSEVPHRVRFGPYEADLRTHELWKHGVRLKLSGQPFQILEVLLSRPGDLITRDELREKLWPEETFVDFSHGLNAAVNKLRDALSDSADDPKYIETLPRRGYRFIGKVETPAMPEPPPVPAPEPEYIPEPALIALPATSPPEILTTRKPAHSYGYGYWKFAVFASITLLGCLFLLTHVKQWLASRAEKEAAEQGLEPSGRAHPIVNVPDSVSDPVLSPDGNQIAFHRKGQTPATAGIFVKTVGADDLHQLTHSPADCCPAWSPDGKSIAFSRVTDGDFAIYTVPSSGGEERKLSWTGPRQRTGEIDWSPDGKSIAFSAANSEDGSSSIFLLPLDSLHPRKLTNPPAGATDWGAAFSPDGQHISFVRTPPEGFPQHIFVTNLSGSESRLFAAESHILGPPAWNADGQSLIYSTTKAGDPTLWRAPINGGEPTAVGDVGANVWHPTVSRRGFRLAFEQIRSASSILQLGIGGGSRRIVTSARGRNEGPQLSPDGKRLAFMSNRSGSMEIWVSAADGSNPVQVTALNGTGTPRWSSDNKTIAFDARLNEPGAVRGAIYIVSADGGEARAVAHGEAENLVPSFSRDGQWIYFGSDRGGSWQVWKIATNGGDPTQVTTRGGFAAQEGPDGYVYYASSRYPNPEIWRVPIGGAGESPLSPKIVPRTWASWAVAPTGIYFVEDSPDFGPVLSFYDFGRHEIRRVTTLDKAPFWLGVSSDGSTLFMDQANQVESSIIMLENFH